MSLVSVAWHDPAFEYRSAPVDFDAHTTTDVGAADTEMKLPATEPRATEATTTPAFAINDLLDIKTSCSQAIASPKAH